MNKEIASLQEELIFRFGYLTNKIGLNKSIGQLYAALYFSKSALDLDQLGRVCRMSKGNVSINIRRLEKWGAAKRVWVQENRKDHYEANRDIMNFVINHSVEIFSGILDEGRGSLDEVKAKLATLDMVALSVEQKNELKAYQENIKDLDNLINKVAKTTKNINSLRKLIGY